MTEDSVAVSEAKRQAVILVFSVLGAVVLIYIMPMQHDASARERFMMRNALRLKRFAQFNADVWGDVALKAGTVYNRYRTI